MLFTQQVMRMWGNKPQNLEDLGLFSHRYHFLASWDLSFHVCKIKRLNYILSKVPPCSKIL